jgi:zinc protease
LVNIRSALACRNEYGAPFAGNGATPAAVRPFVPCFSLELLPQPVLSIFMKILNRLAPLCWLICAVALRAAPAATPVWAHEASDLATDPAVTWGRLDNGLRYAILPNAEPHDRVSVRLLVKAGAFNETDAQQGLAHFTEHMGFQGTRHYAPGKLVEYFQRLGMAFGPDTNASTGFDETIYQVELPHNDAAALTEGFTALHDYADGMLFPAEKIETERGVILAEKRDRDSVEYRAMKDEYAFLLPEALIPRRLPIGLEEVIRTAPRAQFVDYYDTWYRPEKMVLVVVGPVKPAEVAPLIVSTFSDIKDRAPARAEPDRGMVRVPQTVATRLHRDPELSRTTVSLQTIEPYAYEPDTQANRLKYLPREIAYAILNRRFSELAKKEGAPFTAASANTSESFDFLRSSSVEISTPKAAQWRAALAVAEQELRRALQFGFQPAELREITAAYANQLDEAVKQAPTRHSPNLAAALVEVIAHDNVFTHPAVERDLIKPALARLTVDDCLAALRAAWTAPGRLIYLAGNLDLPNPEADITAAYSESRAVPITAAAKIEETKWGYAAYGPTGAVVARREVADLGITQVEFQNGVRLNLKKTDFEAATIRAIARLGGGLLTMPPNKPGLQVFTNGAAGLMGLGKHSVDDLRRILAGHSVGAGLSVANDAFVVSGKTTPTDLELELQLLAAWASDPGYRPEAERLLHRSLSQAYLQMEHTPEGILPLEVERVLANGDPRFGLPPQETLAGYTMNDVRQWLAPELTRGTLELSLVGDLDLEATIALVAKTFGALPARTAKPRYETERHVAFPAARSENARQVPTEIERGLLVVSWPTDDAFDVQRTRRLNVLASVLDDRLRVKVREGLGGAYSPEAYNQSSDTFTHYGTLQVQINVEPAQAAKILAVVREVAASLQKDGVTAEELERAKQPILTSIAESARTNPYWLGAVLVSCQEYPQRLDWCRSRTADITSITREEVAALAARFLLREREVTYVVQPVPMPKTGPAPAAPVPAPPAR